MNPNIKCTCPFGKPEVAIAENCPVHGLFVCTGCGWLSYDKIKPPATACCSENTYIPVREYIERAEVRHSAMLKDKLKMLNDMNNRFNEVMTQQLMGNEELEKFMTKEPVIFLLVNAIRKGDTVMIQLLEALYERTDNRYKRQIAGMKDNEKTYLESLVALNTEIDQLKEQIHLLTNKPA